MREFHLSSGEKIRIGQHAEGKIHKRALVLSEIKETIEAPDITTSDRTDPDGTNYWKQFKGYWLEVCINHGRKTRFVKTVFKRLEKE